MASHMGWARKIFTRRLAVAVLIALGTLVMLIGSFDVWTKRQLLNTDAFANTSSRLLANPDVRNGVATRLVNSLFDNSNVATNLGQNLPPALAKFAPALASGLQQLAIRAANEMLARPRAQEAWHNAMVAAHQAFLRVINNEAPAVSTQGNDVVLNLRPLVVQLAQQLGVPVPARLAESQGGAQVTIMKADQLAAVQTAVRVIKVASWLLVFLAIGFYGAAIWLARDRRREAVRATGASLLGVGLLLLIVRRLVGNALVNALAEGTAAQKSGHASWLILTTLMRDLAIGIVVLGALILVGTWLLGPTRPATAVRRWLAPTLRVHPGLAYTGLAFVYLLVILFWPDDNRRLVGVLILGVVLFSGLEVIRRRCATEFPATESRDSVAAP